jgi:hypothetical protein
MPGVELPNRETPANRLPSSVIRLPSYAPWLAGLALAIAAPLCLGLTALGARQIDLVHATFFNSCSLRHYTLHWQDRERYPDDFRYDYTGSPESLALVEIWIDHGPTLSFSRIIPLPCATMRAHRLWSGDARVK